MRGAHSSISPLYSVHFGQLRQNLLGLQVSTRRRRLLRPMVIEMFLFDGFSLQVGRTSAFMRCLTLCSCGVLCFLSLSTPFCARGLVGRSDPLADQALEVMRFLSCLPHLLLPQAHIRNTWSTPANVRSHHKEVFLVWKTNSRLTRQTFQLHGDNAAPI